MKIRIGNDFVYLWAIARDGQPVDFSLATDISIQIKHSRGNKPITDYSITDNIISVDITPELTQWIGLYNIELSYKLPDATLTDGQREVVVDVNAFEIVNSSECATFIKDLTHTSDTDLGLKGDKGDKGNKGDKGDKGDKGNPFLYSDFTQPQIDAIKQPFLDAAVRIDDKLEVFDEFFPYVPHVQRVRADGGIIESSQELIGLFALNN